MYDSPQTLFLIPISILQWGKPLMFQTLVEFIALNIKVLKHIVQRLME